MELNFPIKMDFKQQYFYNTIRKMGTRGYYVFRYKNKWYVFYNSFDSYPCGLGQDIVNELRNIDWEKVKTLIENIKEEHVNWNGSSYIYDGIITVLSSPGEYRLVVIQDKHIYLENDIEFIYTIDIDNNIFHVNYYTDDRMMNTQKFRLNAIPEDWIDFIY